MKKNMLRKMVAGAVLGISVMCAGVIFGSVDASAAAKAPVVRVRSERITVSSKSTLDVQDNVVKSIKGSAPIKRVTYKVNGGSGAIKVVQNNTLNRKGVPAGRISFNKPGTYKMVVRAIDTKGRVAKKNVTFVVGKSIVKYTNGIPVCSTLTAGMKPNFKRTLSWDRSRVASVKVDASNVNYRQVGEYVATYTITGRAGEVRTVKCPVEVIKGFQKYL